MHRTKDIICIKLCHLTTYDYKCQIYPVRFVGGTYFSLHSTPISNCRCWYLGAVTIRSTAEHPGYADDAFSSFYSDLQTVKHLTSTSLNQMFYSDPQSVKHLTSVSLSQAFCFIQIHKLWNISLHCHWIKQFVLFRSTNCETSHFSVTESSILFYSDPQTVKHLTSASLNQEFYSDSQTAKHLINITESNILFWSTNWNISHQCHWIQGFILIHKLKHLSSMSLNQAFYSDPQTAKHLINVTESSILFWSTNWNISHPCHWIMGFIWIDKLGNISHQCHWIKGFIWIDKLGNISRFKVTKSSVCSSRITCIFWTLCNRLTPRW